MSDYHKLRVWQRSMEFIVDVYRATQTFPAHEQYGLTSQARRAATSIALNIAEGATCGYADEFRRFLRLAIRSANETRAVFEIASRLNYCAPEAAAKQATEAGELAAMLQALVKSLGRAGEPGPEYTTDDKLLTANN